MSQYKIGYDDKRHCVFCWKDKPDALFIKVPVATPITQILGDGTNLGTRLVKTEAPAHLSCWFERFVADWPGRA